MYAQTSDSSLQTALVCCSTPKDLSHTPTIAAFHLQLHHNASTTLYDGQVVSLFNIENESLGLVRNLVGVGLGVKLRSGIQPAASHALALLVRINDRVVGLIEDLDRREQKRRQLEAKRLLALKPVVVSSPFENKSRKRSVFARLSSLSPSSRSRRSLTPPLTPAASPTNSRRPAVGVSLVSKNNSEDGGGGSHYISEGGRGIAAHRITGRGASTREGRVGESNAEDGVFGSEGRPWGGRGSVQSSSLEVPSITSQTSPPRGFLWSAPVLLHSYVKLLNALVCGSYNLRAAFFTSCEADVRNIGREVSLILRRHYAFEGNVNSNRGRFPELVVPNSGSTKHHSFALRRPCLYSLDAPVLNTRVALSTLLSPYCPTLLYLLFPCERPSHCVKHQVNYTPPYTL